jgi:hypothetical protein
MGPLGDPSMLYPEIKTKVLAELYFFLTCGFLGRLIKKSFTSTS